MTLRFGTGAGRTGSREPPHPVASRAISATARARRLRIRVAGKVVGVLILYQDVAAGLEPPCVHRGEDRRQVEARPDDRDVAFRRDENGARAHAVAYLRSDLDRLPGARDVDDRVVHVQLGAAAEGE